jgi:hypothetical protein
MIATVGGIRLFAIYNGCSARKRIDPGEFGDIAVLAIKAATFRRVAWGRGPDLVAADAPSPTFMIVSGFCREN